MKILLVNDTSLNLQKWSWNTAHSLIKSQRMVRLNHVQKSIEALRSQWTSDKGPNPTSIQTEDTFVPFLWTDPTVVEVVQLGFKGTSPIVPKCSHYYCKVRVWVNTNQKSDMLSLIKSRKKESAGGSSSSKGSKGGKRSKSSERSRSAITQIEQAEEDPGTNHSFITNDQHLQNNSFDEGDYGTLTLGLSDTRYGHIFLPFWGQCSWWAVLRISDGGVWGIFSF